MPQLRKYLCEEAEMLNEKIEARWIDMFESIFQSCKLNSNETAVILSETQSRLSNINLSELALGKMGVKFFHLQVPSPLSSSSSIIRSSGASLALNDQSKAVDALSSADFVIDLTLEGLMHSSQTKEILRNGTRIMTISNEHPEILERCMPELDLKDRVLAASRLCRASSEMVITSDRGTNLSVNMKDNNTVGVWGYTDKPGTLAHWPGGLVVTFPRPNSVNGTLIFQPGDINLTFKKYFDSEVICTIENDYITKIEGKGSDGLLIKKYLEAFGDKECYATSHVGWGLNRSARYEALTMYDKNDLNGTELRTLAGSFLYSTGANEFANRFTEGHFDLPMMNCTINIDGQDLVKSGNLIE
mgnify:FL=1